jgi:signal transduction histidine kinase
MSAPMRRRPLLPPLMPRPPLISASQRGHWKPDPLPSAPAQRGSHSLRWRLTALYGGLFLLAGLTMLAIVYALLARRLPRAPRVVIPAIEARDNLPPRVIRALDSIRSLRTALIHQRDNALHELLTQSVIALAVVTVIAAVLGWLVAGRALRPLRDITATARRLSTHNLGERINLQGPDDELKELADTFDGMLNRLSGAFEAQRQFVAHASHELRTPLTVQRAAIDVALEDPAPTIESMRTMALRVRDATERNERLIASLLTLARSQAGIERFDDVDLAGAARTAIAAIPSHGVTVQPMLGPAHLAGDPGLVERLIVNLVDNAVRHNVPGGWVRVETWPAGHTATLRVSNSGRVLPPEQVEGLFTPFHRMPGDRSGDGYGLGLSIVDAVVAAHHGSRTARALPDGGLEVTVVLPASPPVVAPTPP